MNNETFTRETSRTFVVAPGFAPIVALCGEGELLRRHFKAETDAGRIVIILNEKDSPDLNGDKIALCDELFIINPSGQYDDFQAAMFLTAQRMVKHIRVLKP